MFVFVSLSVLVIVSTLSNPLNAEIAEARSSEQRQLKEVSLQARGQDSQNDNDIVVTEMIGVGGGYLEEVLYTDNSDELLSGGVAIAKIRKDALSREETVKLTISSENTTVYPDANFLNNVYPVEELTYIGPLATLEIPSSSLNLNQQEDQLLFLIRPSFYEGELTRVKQRDIRLEVRVFLEDGDVAFHTMRFGYAGEAPIWSDFLKASFGDDLPETLKISVQAVDISEALPDPDDSLGP